MGFNFPSSPTNGQTFVSGNAKYIFNGTGWMQQDPSAPASVAYVDNADAQRVLRGGDTMTGPLALPADPLGPLQASTKQYVDNKVGTLSYLPLTGGTLSGDLTITKSNANFFLNKTASGEYNRLTGQKAGLNRWTIALGNSSAESTGNAGSDFGIQGWADDGSPLSTYLFVSRATGYVSIGNAAPLHRLHVGDGTTDTALTGLTDIYLCKSGSTGMVIRNNATAVELMNLAINEGIVGTFTNHPFYLRTNNVNRISIDTAGNVGIGVTPAYKLDVQGSLRTRVVGVHHHLRANRYGVYLYNDDGNFYFLLTNVDDPDGAWNSLRPFYFDLATGNVAMLHSVTVGALNGPYVTTSGQLTAAGPNGALAFRIAETGSGYNKYLRTNNAGTLEFVNHANSVVIMTLSDGGNLATNGSISSAGANLNGAVNIGNNGGSLTFYGQEYHRYAGSGAGGWYEVPGIGYRFYVGCDGGTDVWRVYTTGYGNGISMDNVGNVTIPKLAAGAFSPTGMITTAGSVGDINYGGSSSALQVVGAGGGNASFMSFHRPGSFALNFGVRSDNVLAVGGWSMGGVQYAIWHEGNFAPGNYVAKGGDSMSGSLGVAGWVNAGNTGGAGIYYCGNSGGRYFYFDGSQYIIGGGAYNSRAPITYVACLYDSLNTQAFCNARGHDDVSAGLWCGCNASGSITSNIRSPGSFESANGSYGYISDRKLKKRITPATPKLDGVMQVEIINFEFDETKLKGFKGIKQIGVADDNIAAIWPGLVYATPPLTVTEPGRSEPDQPKPPDKSWEVESYNIVRASVLFGPVFMKAFQEFVLETREEIAQIKRKLQ